MSIISPICGTKRSKPCWKGYEMIGMKRKGKRVVPNCVPKKRIGSAPKNVSKQTKLYLIQDYFDWKRMGYSDVGAEQNTLKVYSKYHPEVYELHKKTLRKLIDKNKEYLKKSLDADKFVLNTNSIKV